MKQLVIVTHFVLFSLLLSSLLLLFPLSSLPVSLPRPFLPPCLPLSSLPHPSPPLPTPTEGSAYEGSSSTHEGVQSFATLDTKLFNRTFTKNDYFYCERCRTYNFNHSDDTQDSTSAFPHPCLSHNNGSSETCSHVDMAEAVIYLGDISADKPNSEL